ncbi:MAG: YdcF family protein [Bacteroidia bacterium]
MFFILSKLFTFIITPIIWVSFLLLISIFTKNTLRKKRCLYAGVGLLLLFSNSFIFDEVVRVWEINAVAPSKIKNYDVGILLGGMSVYDQELDRAQFYRGVDRLMQTIELYKTGKIKKIIFTGGSGRLLHPEMKEGVYLKRYFLYLGVPEKDFLIESESNNTHENAVFTKILLEQKNFKGDFLLITSAFHMRRSSACFEKVGIKTTPYSTDRYAGPRKFEFDFLFIPNASAMNDWSMLIHEIVGYVTYKIMGYG